MGRKRPRPDGGFDADRRGPPAFGQWRGGGKGGGGGFGGGGGGGRGGPPPGARPPSGARARPPPPAVDREATCPFLLRVFPTVGGAPPPRPADFDAALRHAPPGAPPPPPRRQQPRGPGRELHVYTWADATLRELRDLLGEALPAAAAPGARLDLALVYPDRAGRAVVRRVGRLRAGRGGAGPDGGLALAQVGFEAGDLLAVSVAPPGR